MYYSACFVCFNHFVPRSIEWESEVRRDGELYYIVSDPLHVSKNTSERVTEINNGTADPQTSGVKDPTPKSWRNGGKI